MVFSRSRVFPPIPCVVAATLAGGGLFPAASVRAQTLVNAGFETPVQNGNFQYTPTGAGVGWTFVNGSGVAGNGSGFTFGNNAAPEGVQVGFLQGANSSFSQSVNFASAARYTVGFFAAQRQSGGGTQPSNQSFMVLLDSTLLGTFTPTPNNPAYQSFTTSFVDVSAGSHTLSFSTPGTNLGDVTAFVDSVRFNVVSAAAPEPSAALLLVGTAPLTFAGLLLRRRKR